jgi:NAD(P)-dependent dehydrogenase (short-subunit alcohol dehydrogenase family)
VVEPSSSHDVAGRSVLITGATSGIGLQSARTLASLGARLTLVGRDRERTQRIATEIGGATGTGEPRVLVADLSSLEQVEGVAGDFLAQDEPLDVLVNCAGAVFGLRREESVDGIEMTFALNHLAYFALTAHLLPRLRESGPSRIVNVSGGDAHKSKNRFDFDNYDAAVKYRPIRQYEQSKLANLLFTQELARRLGDSSVTANAVSPHRTSATRFAHNVHPLAKVAMTVARPFLLSTEKAAEPVVHAATSAELEGVNGSYWCGMSRPELTEAATNAEDAVRLWDLSVELTGLDGTTL